MAMACPQCRTTYDQRLNCPVCGARLSYWDARRGGRRFAGLSGWHQTAPGRVLLGLLLAQGLFFALRHLLKGLVLTLGDEAAEQLSVQQVQGLVVLQAMQLVPLLLGAVLAGSGRASGALYGLVVGLCNGILCVAVNPVPEQSASTVALYGQPLLQAVVGMLGGWLGSLIWKPLPPSSPHGPVVRKRAAAPRVPLFAGPVAWTRVLCGVAIACAGSLFAAAILGAVADASGGKLDTTYELQDLIVTWEIKALAILFGAGLAGATTFNGLKQGFWVGLGTTAILCGTLASSRQGIPSVVLLTVISSMTLSIAGGWFGSQLFPPVVARRSTRNLGPMA